MIAVLTADLVNSTKLKPIEISEVLTWLECYSQNQLVPNDVKFAIYRGDEFQISFNKPEIALYHTVLLKLKLQIAFKWKQNCTMSLAFGDVDLMTETPQTSQGPVFITSGRNLSKTNKAELTISSTDALGTHYHLLQRFVNHQLSKLTKSQIDLMILYFEHNFPEHRIIAELTNTSRQNISNRLSSMGADLVKEFVLTLP